MNTIEFIADESGVISRANLLRVILFFFSFTFAVVPCGIFFLFLFIIFFMRMIIVLNSKK